MNVLLNTHAFLWWIADDPRLFEHARTLICDSGTSARFSVVSAWEIAIKASPGRLRVPTDLAAFLLEQIAMNRFEVLAIGLLHALAVHERLSRCYGGTQRQGALDHHRHLHPRCEAGSDPGRRSRD